MTIRAEKAKVLIVEDEIIIAADLETRLKGLGYTICGKAISADKALDLVKRHQPDLVMMDILLRGEMDGIDAAEIIRDQWGIPVVFLTAYADADRLERAKLAYPFGYLLKPFHDRDLKITTEMALYISRVDAERRKAEAELKKYQELISEINDLAYICDSDGNVTFINKAFETMTGRKIEEFIGKPFAPLFDTDELEKAMHAYRSTLNGARPHYELQFKDSRIICEYKNIPIRDNNNEIIGVMGIARDITARKLSEEVLRESETRLAALSDAPFESIFFSDQGICIDQNLSAEREFGYNREEAVGRPGTDWIIPADRELVRKNIMTGRETPYEVTALRKDGTTFPAEIQGRMLNYQGRRIRVTALRNIIERKKTDEALKESENRYRTIIDLSPLGFGMVDTQGVILDCNNALASMLGHEINELKGKNFGEITHPDDLKIEQELLSPVWDDEHKSYTLEKRYRHKNGHHFWVNLTATKMQSLSGDTAYVFGFIEDISNRKEMESEREKLISELQEALKEIKELRGFFPICANCKKIRDDEGYWQQIEQYIQERTDARFSHGICPDCAKKIYPELYQE